MQQQLVYSLEIKDLNSTINRLARDHHLKHLNSALCPVSVKVLILHFTVSQYFFLKYEEHDASARKRNLPQIFEQGKKEDNNSCKANYFTIFEKAKKRRD